MNRCIDSFRTEVMEKWPMNLFEICIECGDIRFDIRKENFLRKRRSSYCICALCRQLDISESRLPSLLWYFYFSNYYFFKWIFDTRCNYVIESSSLICGLMWILQIWMLLSLNLIACKMLQFQDSFQWLKLFIMNRWNTTLEWGLKIA